MERGKGGRRKGVIDAFRRATRGPMPLIGELCFLWGQTGDCPNFRGHRSEAVVVEHGTVPFDARPKPQPGNPLSMPLFESITDLTGGSDLLRQGRYGLIEAADGQFRRVAIRPFPKLVSVPGILLIGGWRHRRQAGDRICLYYNQPRRFPNFLAIKYVESARDTSIATLTRAMAVLDLIARIKQSDALLCDVANAPDHHQAARPLGLGTALSVVVPPALHQAVLRQVSLAAAVDRRLSVMYSSCSA